jgi:hypothetical protein
LPRRTRNASKLIRELLIQGIDNAWIPTAPLASSFPAGLTPLVCAVSRAFWTSHRTFAIGMDLDAID